MVGRLFYNFNPKFKISIVNYHHIIKHKLKLICCKSLRFNDKKKSNEQKKNV